ncbi:MAG: M2 family metallopeptidase [Bdellovibrionaceae bacterium]|nr:M2 family metallopeptidase [Pseudobdellovibrionaceae bacterium]
MSMKPPIIFSAALLLTAVSQAKSTKTFLEEANKDLGKDIISVQRAEWVQNNFITMDTTILASEANARFGTLGTDYALQSKKYRGSSEDEKRQLYLLMGFLNLPSPKNSSENEKMTQLKAELESAYGSGKYCKNNKCRDLQTLENVLAESRKPEELKDAWEGWKSISIPMKPKYQKVVEYANVGAKELGYKHLADFWKSKYDMSETAFEKELDRLWSDVKPFYEQLHCYVRTQLNKKYGDKVAPKTGPIPAQLMGNMWGQSWENIRDIVGVDPKKSLDITSLLKKAKYDSRKMTKTAENFFVSLGMPTLPATFYERSLLDKPRDRDVVCHASAWDIDLKDDVRIKMCIQIDEDNFRTIHHELGHIYYYLAYKDQPVLFQGAANDGFHEAIGDTIQLSITRQYLQDIGLLKSNKAPKDADIHYLLQMALQKIAFLPFGLMIDKYRWQIFDGRIPYDQYNTAWWDMVEKYQGLKPPEPRPQDAFDAGSKYHVPSFVPYSRYFIAHILQFQFHRALCETAGFKGPLHECSIYNNRQAGDKLWKMLQMGASKPWPEALAVVTGKKEMDATAIREYFAPLETWLKEKNKGQSCGW